MMDEKEKANVINKKLADLEKRKREREKSDLEKLLSVPEGRRFMWRIIERCHVWKNLYDGDVNKMLIDEGERTIGLSIFKDIINTKPSAFIQMQNEYNSEKKRHEDEVKSIREGVTGG